MKNLILSIMFIFILSLISVNAQTKTPILADTFTLNDAVTLSDSFVNVDSKLINVSRQTSGFIRMGFEGSKLSGTADITDFFWRILFDGIEVINITHALEVLEVVPLELQQSLGLISVGIHNITLQHRIEVNSMSTRKISVTFVTNQFPNGSQAIAVNDTLNFTVDDIEVFTKAVEFNFTKISNDSVIFVSYFGLLSSDTSSNFDVEIFGSINDEQSGIFGSGIESPDDNKFISYSWMYENIVSGINTVEIFARNVQNTKVGMFQGDIDIIELEIDNLQANQVNKEIGTFSTSSTSPVFIESMLINVSNNASLMILVETTATKSGSGKDNFSMFITVDSIFIGVNRTMELEAAADVANFAIIEVPSFSPAMVGERNVTLFGMVQSPTTVTFTNISFISIELIPLQFIEVDTSTNLDVFQSKNPVEILESFTLFANYTIASSGLPVLNAACFANSSRVSGGASGFGRGVLGIGGLSTIGNAVHTQINDIFGNNTLRVDIDNIPLGKLSYAINFRFHAHNQTPTDDLRVFASCHNNLTFTNFTLFGQVNTTEVVISTSTGNNTIWGFKNIVLFGTQVATSNCSIVFESMNTSIDKHWMIADTTTGLNLNNSFTSTDFGNTYVLRSNANERSPFVDAGFGLNVPNETTMLFNSTSNLYFLDNIRHGRPFDFEDRVFCSSDTVDNATAFVVTNVEDNVAPIVQITSIDPSLIIFNASNVTIQWSVNDPELLVNFINVSFPNGSLLVQSETKPLILTPTDLTVVGNYSVVAFANDTGGLFTLTNVTFEVIIADVGIPVITLLFPLNNTINNTVPLNITFIVTDDSANLITCILSNTTTIFDDVTVVQSVNSNITLAKGFISLSQNFPNLELTCFDNSFPFNNSATLNLNYTLDTIPPVIIPITPLDGFKFNKIITSAINIKANCTDVPVFRFNITIENSSDRIFSFEDRNPINNIISINEVLDLTNIASGFYDMTLTCSDPHTTRKLSGDYNVRKNISGNSIRWVTPSNNQFTIRYLQNSIDMSDFGSSKSIQEDRYNFWFDTNRTESKVSRTFIFEIKSKYEVFYIEDSDYRGHFITGTNFIDFQFDDPDAHYLITKNSNGDYEIEITTTKTKLNFNSVGDLNVVSQTLEFEVFEFKPLEEFFKVDVCAFDTLTNVFIFSFIMLLGIIVILVGWLISSSAVSFLGALMFFFMGIFIFACSLIFSTLIMLSALSMMAVFVLQGAKGKFGFNRMDEF